MNPARALRRAVVSAVIALGWVARPAAAWGFERQWHAGIDAGYARLFGQSASSGFGGGAHVAYGLSDTFNALLEIDATAHPSAGSVVYSGAAGLAYTFDVARAVPYAGFLGGVYAARGDFDKTAAMVQFVAGLDYELERNWAIGIQLRVPVASITPDVRTIFSVSSNDTNGYATTFLRVEYLWGF